ncbi:MAG: ABC transporter ATP-binding protein [Nitrospinae bacterium]|nr:ABC transporter ATP-binding protein [Nitrospinota bacterium]
MLEAIGVSRRYGWRWALKDLNLSVSPGETLALLGKNGSGKTTLLKTLAGLLKPTQGAVRLSGQPISREAKGRIGLLSHEPMLYEGLTVRENLEYFARLFDVEREEMLTRVDLLAGTLEIEERLDEPVRVLSQGFRQRAAFMRTLLHTPEVVLLDEPFSGLDTNAVQRLESVIDLMRDLREYIVVFTTHDLSKAFEMAERIAVLAGGRLVYEEDVENSSEEDVSAAFDEYAGGSA